MARAINTAAEGTSPFQPIPAGALQLFNELAARAPFIFFAWRYHERTESPKAPPLLGPPRTVPWPEDPENPLDVRIRVPYQTLLNSSRPPGRSKHVLDLDLYTPSPVCGVVATLADYLVNPCRDRLRRCGRCQRWFVDKTRNRSSRRCSAARTIAWSNSQRVPKKQKRQQGRPRATPVRTDA